MLWWLVSASMADVFSDGLTEQERWDVLSVDSGSEVALYQEVAHRRNMGEELELERLLNLAEVRL